MLLRKANAQDVPAMWQLEKQIFGADAWSLELLSAEITGPYRHYLLLSESGAATSVSAYAGLLLSGDSADIQTIAVAAHQRGKGLGKQLMRELIAIAGAGGATEIFLEVRKDNPVAQKLYESFDFIAIAERPGYYQPGNVAAIVMRRTLQENQCTT